MAPETRSVKRKQATTEEETTTTKKSKTQTQTQTRVAERKQPTNKEETTTKGKVKGTVAAKGKGKGSVAAKEKGKGSVAAKGKGKGLVAPKGKGKGSVAAKGKGKTTPEKSGSQNSYVSTSDSTDVSDFSVDEDYYDSDDDHYDSPLDSDFPSKEEVMEIAHNKIEIIKTKGVGDEEYKALITKLKRLRKFKDTPPEEVYQAAVDLMSSKKERVTITEEKVTELVNWYVHLRLTELAVVITTLLKTRDWDMKVAIFVKDMAEKYLKLLKLKLPRLEKLCDTADEVSKLKEGSHLFPEAIQTLRLNICTWIWERCDDYDSEMRGMYNLDHIC